MKLSEGACATVRQTLKNAAMTDRLKQDAGHEEKARHIATRINTANES